MKLYKYRPLNDFLFKELKYQEIYFSSYSELNDPLDLSARIDFTPKNDELVSYLVWFIVKTTLKISDHHLTEFEIKNNQALLRFNNDPIARESFTSALSKNLSSLKKTVAFISLEELEIALSQHSKKLKFIIDFDALKAELNRLSKTFLENSYVNCFSEVNNDFLMWSHYASKHSGICIEFNLDRNYLFPYRSPRKRKPNKKKYLERMSKWKVDEVIYWDRIHKVIYKDQQPHINFFEFIPVFDNEDDIDLIELSKTWTHKYAFELETVFSTKTEPWKYEKEWRAIQINFGKVKEPEDRIRHYPIECASSIYFGIRTPESVKHRIYNILSSLKSDIKYFTCIPSNGRELFFTPWEYSEF